MDVGMSDTMTTAIRENMREITTGNNRKEENVDCVTVGLVYSFSNHFYLYFKPVYFGYHLFYS